MTDYRIYYEDTDAAGVVYYANYLRYFERGRAEFLRERGLSVRDLQEQGYIFPVVHLEIDYRAPAVLDDLIRVETAVEEVTGATLTLRQRVVRVADGKGLVEGRVTLACFGPDRRVKRLPKALVQLLKGA